MRKIKCILLIFFVAIFISCDAPRLNPFDSQNPDNKLGTIDGYIVSSSQNRLSGVTVIWKNQNIFTLTDSQGYFKIENIQMKNGILIFEKERIARDSFYIDWNNQKVKHLQEIVLTYVRGEIYGYVFTTPREALPNVKVFWKNQNVYTETNPDGFYKLENVSMNNGWLYFEKEGYSKDSFYVQWDKEEIRQISDIILYPTIGTIDGYVYASPRSALSQVRILWKNQNIITLSNASGYYKLINIEMKNGWLYFEKDGFATDSVYINWNNQKEIRVNEVILYHTKGTIDGYVYDVTGKPIQKVKVFWENQKLFDETNLLGYYKLENVAIKSGWLFFEKEGFNKDSVFINWGNQNNIRVTSRILTYSLSSIYGYVKTVALPRKALPYVNVYWKNQSILTQTDATGRYQFDNLSKNNGWLYFEKEGYSRDSVFVQFNNQAIMQIEDRFLNANPRLTSFSLFTTVQNRYPDIQVQRLYVQATIEDDESDLDSVFVKNYAINFSKRLLFNPETGKYENNFRTVDLKVGSLEELIGKDFIITVKDKMGRSFTIGSSGIKRVILKEIVIVSPLNKAIVGNSPTFVWNKFSSGFNFRYTVQVYTDETAPILFWEKKDISKDVVEVACDTILPPGDYFWVISCIDDYNNSSISKPGTFTVK